MHINWKSWNHVTKLDPDKHLSPEQITGVVTSGTDALMLSGTLNVTRENMQELLRQIEQYYMRFRKQDLMSILEAWRQCSATLGRRVRIDMRSSRIDGTAVDIDADGGLLVRRDSGIIEKVLAGDVVHCR